MIPDQRSIAELIQKAVQSEVTKAIEEELAPTRKRIEEKVRGEVGRIAARVLDKFSYEMRGQTLVISVNFENTTKT